MRDDVCSELIRELLLKQIRAIDAHRSSDPARRWFGSLPDLAEVMFGTLR